MPHLHTPALQRSLAPALQVVHGPPSTPQALVVTPLLHTLPEQQPAHDDASQTQPVPSQRRPLAQAAPLPQPQVPSARQTLLVCTRQFTQVPASRPQLAVVDGFMQVVPAQQPEPQVVLSHTQAWPTQCWPGAQTVPPGPQLHCPPGVQRSARSGSHAVQAPPSMPHAAAEGVVQVAPLQQPLPQVAALQPWHAWPVQVWPLHDAQAFPPAPQAVACVPG